LKGKTEIGTCQRAAGCGRDEFLEEMAQRACGTRQTQSKYTFWSTCFHYASITVSANRYLDRKTGLRCTKDLVVFPGLILVLMRAQQPSGLKNLFSDTWQQCRVEKNRYVQEHIVPAPCRGTPGTQRMNRVVRAG